MSNTNIRFGVDDVGLLFFLIKNNQNETYVESCPWQLFKINVFF